MLGDLEEAHRQRLRVRGALLARLLTGLEALDMAIALLRSRRPRLGLSWLDVKLGLRMLVKHPGLTVLGSLSMAFAIFVGAGSFELIGQVVKPRLLLPEGDRLVGLRLWNAARSATESRALFDLGVWRDELETIEELSAYRSFERNLVTSDGRAEPLVVAAIDAAGLRAAGVAPLHGRTLVESDARPGAEPVVVIGHEVWIERFAGDPAVIGRTIRLDATPTTVVGIMPEGYRFPAVHDLWVPLARDEGAYQPLEGPGVAVLGRLAADATLDEANAELEVVGERMAAEFPATHEHLRPQVMPYARAVLGLPASLSTVALTSLGLISNVPLVLFLLLVCGNVALLLFARASSREIELVVRSALGASRRRLVLQLFTEALVLAALATVIGLSVAQYALEWVLRITESILLEGDSLPFWFRPALSTRTFVYAALLTVVAAAVAGGLPGLNVTRRLGPQLQQVSARGGGFRFGGVWTVVITLQIAVTMVFPIISQSVRAQREDELLEDLDLASEQYLSARLDMEQISSPAGGDGSLESSRRNRFLSAVKRLESRLLAEPRVAGVTFTDRLPRDYHQWRQVEIDGPTAPPRDERGHRLGSANVDVGYLEVLGGEVVAGRGFRPSDLDDGPSVVVVNESFAERVLGGRSAIGQRVRYLASEDFRDPDQDPGPWHEIVGVVEDLGTLSGYGPMGMYHPAAAGDLNPVHLVVHASGEAPSFGPILRALAVEVDPALRLHDLVTLDQVTQGQQEFFAFWWAVLLSVTAMALLLSLGGIFAVMSFTVTRRSREIGIRVALGSSRPRVVATVLRRPLVQIALGLATGSLVLAALLFGLGEVDPTLASISRIFAYAGIIGLVLLLASISPALRALGVDPGEALRVE